MYQLGGGLCEFYLPPKNAGIVLSLNDETKEEEEE